jgi:hypothetical protein
MARSLQLIALTALLTASRWIQEAYAAPNFVFILSDDQGKYGVGWRNSEIISPNLDSLARTGVILDEFYTYKYCSPTRYRAIAPHVYTDVRSFIAFFTIKYLSMLLITTEQHF